MDEHGAAGEMELGVWPGGYTGIGPRHPGVRITIRIEENRPLGQKLVALAEGILDGPVHSKPELSLSAGDIDSFPIARDDIHHRNDLNGAV